MHKIDEKSPLYGLTEQNIRGKDVSLSVSIAGQDDTFDNMVHARHSYGADKFFFGKRFVDIIHDVPENNEIIMDLTKFHMMVDDGLPPLEEVEGLSPTLQLPPLR